MLFTAPAVIIAHSPLHAITRQHGTLSVCLPTLHGVQFPLHHGDVTDCLGGQRWRQSIRHNHARTHALSRSHGRPARQPGSGEGGGRGWVARQHWWWYWDRERDWELDWLVSRDVPHHTPDCILITHTHTHTRGSGHVTAGVLGDSWSVRLPSITTHTVDKPVVHLTSQLNYSRPSHGRPHPTHTYSNQLCTACVCVCVRAQGKRLELSTQNLVDVQRTAVVRHALTLRSRDWEIRCWCGMHVDMTA